MLLAFLEPWFDTSLLYYIFLLLFVCNVFCCLCNHVWNYTTSLYHFVSVCPPRPLRFRIFSFTIILLSLLSLLFYVPYDLCCDGVIPHPRDRGRAASNIQMSNSLSESEYIFLSVLFITSPPVLVFYIEQKEEWLSNNPCCSISMVSVLKIIIVNLSASRPPPAAALVSFSYTNSSFPSFALSLLVLHNLVITIWRRRLSPLSVL